LYIFLYYTLAHYTRKQHNFVVIALLWVHSTSKQS